MTSRLTRSTTTPVAFATGDGMTASFPLLPGISGVDAELAQIYRQDWRGQQLLSTTPRSNVLAYSSQFDNAYWAKYGTSVTPNATTAPDGTLTAAALDEGTTTSGHYLYKSLANSGLYFTATIYVKAGTRTMIGFGNGGGLPCDVKVDLTTGAIISQSASKTCTVTPVGNGWYRIEVDNVQQSTASGPVVYMLDGNGNTSYTGDGASYVYIWGAQFEQNPAATPYIATPGYNLLTNSQQFDTSTWAKNSSSVIANAATAPDGTLTAYKLVENTQNTYHYVYQNYAVTAGTTYTFSAYLKAAERTYAALEIAGTPDGYAYVDLVAGVVTTPRNCVASIVPDQNGFFRVSITVAITVSATVKCNIFCADNGTTGAHPGDGTSGVYVWGAQLEAASQASTYQPTGVGGPIVTDYSIDDNGNVTFGQVPTLAAILSWGGSFTYFPAPVDAPSFARSTIISQYANSPIICQLIENMGQYLDPSADIDAFYDTVWNVETATGFGLDFWGKVVNVSRQLNIPGALTDFGFKEQAGAQPFGQAPLYLTAPKSTVYALSDTAYRALILAKALANISDCTPPSINQLLQNMFQGRGRCYVTDLGNMQMNYVFEFALQPYEVAIITQSGALPRPAAIGAKLLQVDIPTTFGFAETGTPTIDTAIVANVYTTSWQGQQLQYLTPRTNLLTHSSQFDNAAWSKSNCTVAPNATTAPDGTPNGTKLIEDTATAQHYVYQNSGQYGNTFTGSIYVKAAERTRAFIRVYKAANVYALLDVDLTTGNVLNTSNPNVSALTYQVQALANGWYRVAVTGTSTYNGPWYLLVNAADSTESSNYSITNYVGDGASGIYIWGAQLEVGTAATAYIPTTSAAVTVTDLASVNGGMITFNGNPASGAAISWDGTYSAAGQLVTVNGLGIAVADGNTSVFQVKAPFTGQSPQPFGQGVLFNTDTGLINATV